MTRLRHYGVYKLPGVRRAVYAVPNGSDTYSLYDRELGATLPPRFEVSADGLVTNWFKDMNVWTVDDLIDTGETYQVKSP
jgi:hypothetical protein